MDTFISILLNTLLVLAAAGLTFGTVLYFLKSKAATLRKALTTTALLLAALFFDVKLFNRIDYNYVNPDMILDMDTAYRAAKEAEEAKAMKKALAGLTEADYAGAPFIGAADADVVVLEFYDYTCPYCARMVGPVDQLIAGDSKVKVVLKQLVIHPPFAMMPAKAIIAAKDQGTAKVQKFHELLMQVDVLNIGRAAATGGELSKAVKAIDDAMFETARKAGLDIAKFKAAYGDAKTLEAELVASRELAQKLGLSGTPAFVIGKEVIIPGATSLEALKEAVAKARK